VETCHEHVVATENRRVTLYYLALQQGGTPSHLPLLVSMMADHLASGGHVPDYARAKIETTLSPPTPQRA